VLDGLPKDFGRVEIAETYRHWETAYVAPQYALARGWERQLDHAYAARFYDRTLTASSYGSWLAGNAVEYVALPDTQLDPSKASTVAQQFASNKSIVGVIGPAGSDEVEAAAPILKKAGLAFASGSATRVSLTDGKLSGFFFRDVPNDVAANVFSNVSTVEIAEPGETNYRGVSVQRCN